MQQDKKYHELLGEMEDLKWQLEEANDALQAIKTGQVDALVVKNENGHQLYTLKSADQTYRVFIENMNEGAITLNEEGVILYSNSKFAQMVDIPLSHVIGSNLRSFIPAKHTMLFNAVLEQAWILETKAEQFLKSAKGKEIPFLVSFKKLKLEQGTEMSVLLTDLSLQKEAEKELNLKNELLTSAHNATALLNLELEKKVHERTRDLFTSREHFKFLADNLPVMIWTALPNGELNYYNKKWYDYTGSTFEQTKGWGWESIVHPDDLPLCLDKWNLSIQTGRPYSIETRYKRADGAYRWHHGHAMPFRNDLEEIVAWFGISTDIEDQKVAMQKKDDFISIVSHELKTPLTSLKAYIQLAIKTASPQVSLPLSQYIQKADLFTKKLEHLINDIMDVSRIQAGKLQFTVAEINVNKLVSNCIENSRLLFPEITFTFNAEKEFFIEGNYERLEQVISNLINNAVKYAPESNKIILSVLSIKDSVKVSVTDFGIGLTADQKELIFGRFYRIASISGYFSGLGMGLYISSEIIKAHRGSMGVDSRLNGGSTFYFTLPVSR